VLWAPVLVWELLARRGQDGLRERGPWLAAAAAAACALPDLAWNLFLAPASGAASERGLGWQLGRVGLGWSFGPLALFLRPLGHLAVEPVVSEYASMMPLAGGLLLAGAAASLALFRDREARFLQRLGLVPFLVLCFVASRGGGTQEFWWADLAVVPFAILTAGVAARLRFAPAAAALALAATLPGTLALLGTRENCFPARWPAPPPAALERCLESQRAFVARFRERDHAALTHLRAWRLPAAAFYEESLLEYDRRLARGPLGAAEVAAGWPFVPAERRDAERAWAAAERARLARDRRGPP
jgi:hypothetical protein